ncbi:MAG: electron transfer flavoprotein subunit alpha/FixB family protein [Acidimicrobiaceae bacterium]|nr:electron transfer flavoprotein subunit alpha/FixB family protein [Acidimicrobiaceae bacterium]
MNVSSIWVVVEASNGSLTATSLELLSHARTLTPSVSAVTWDTHDSVIAQQVGDFGATTLYEIDHLDGMLPGVPVASAITALIDSQGAPAAILIPASYNGRDIAGRLSARLDRPVLANVTRILDEGGLVTEHQIFGGTQTIKARFTDEGTAIIVVRAKSFTASPNEGSVATVVKAPIGDVGPTGAAEITKSHIEELTGPKLEEAPIVVSGGRGLGDTSGYRLIDEVAALLHGAPGASRAIVDAGWVPYSHQVGQTGKTVKPTVYIACGISGATQHVVGMKGSKYIIAINKDADAPIFQISDLGIVGDVHSVLPALIGLLKTRE